MKKISLLFVALLLTMTTATAQQTPVETIMEHVRAEGYVPVIDDYGDISFKVEGRTYKIRTGEKDSQGFYYVSLLCYLWSDDVEADKAIRAVNSINDNYKMATVSYSLRDDGNINYMVDCATFVAEPEDYLKVFGRILSNIKTVASDFSNALYN